MFSWPDYLGSIWTRSVKICTFILVGFGAVDFLTNRFHLGIPSLSSKAQLGPLWFLALLVLIALVAALAESWERLGVSRKTFRYEGRTYR